MRGACKISTVDLLSHSICFFIWAESRSWAVFLICLLTVRGFSQCLVLSNVSKAYMCFADKKRKMNWQTLSQTRQESTVWTKWKLDCFADWSQDRCSKLSGPGIVLNSGTQPCKEEEGRADLRDGGKLKEKRRAFIWDSKLAGYGLSGHRWREGTIELITATAGPLLIGTITQWFPISRAVSHSCKHTGWSENSLRSRRPWRNVGDSGTLCSSPPPGNSGAAKESWLLLNGEGRWKLGAFLTPHKAKSAQFANDRITEDI